MKQLSFQLSIVFELNGEKRRLSTKLLQKENGDYKFILNSFGKRKAEDWPKVRQFFKI